MRKYIVFLLALLLIFPLTGCDSEENTEKVVMIESLHIEEGCYKRENNSNNLICFTKDLSYFDVFYKDGKYYRDDYYHTSLPNEETQYTYKFNGDSVFNIYYYENGKEYLGLICLGQTNNTFDCSEIVSPEVSPSGQAESNKVLYTKVEKKFDKDTIENLPLYERNKEFNLNFDGEDINCNLTRSYSITNSNSGLVIANCLNKKYNKNFKISQLNSSNDWQIYNKELGNSHGNDASYLISNYSYNVDVNGTSFNYLKGFPIDPYVTNDKMTVNITKKITLNN